MMPPLHGRAAASGPRAAAVTFIVTLIAATLAMAPGLAGAGGTPTLGISLLGQREGPDRAVDDAVRRHLVSRGFVVTMLDQGTEPGDVADTDLVMISSTVAAKDVSNGWRRLAVPLLTWENDLLDDLAMTGKRHDQDFGEAGKERYLWLVNAPHAMGAGLPAGVANVYLKQAGMSWGRPGLGATTIATLYGQPEKAAIFGYETGATMDYEALAPARRVMFFLGNGTFTNLSPAGLQLFDAAVDWAAGTR